MKGHLIPKGMSTLFPTWVFVARWLVTPVCQLCTSFNGCLPENDKLSTSPIMATYLLSWYLPFLLTIITFSTLFFVNLLIDSTRPFSFKKILFITLVITNFVSSSRKLWPFLIGEHLSTIIHTSIFKKSSVNKLEDEFWTHASTFCHEALGIHWLFRKYSTSKQALAFLFRILTFVSLVQFEKNGFHFASTCMYHKIPSILDTLWMPSLLLIHIRLENQRGSERVTTDASRIVWFRNCQTDLKCFVHKSVVLRVMMHTAQFLLGYILHKMWEFNEGRDSNPVNWILEFRCIDMALEFTAPSVYLVAAVWLTS